MPPEEFNTSVWFFFLSFCLFFFTCFPHFSLFTLKSCKSKSYLTLSTAFADTLRRNVFFFLLFLFLLHTHFVEENCILYWHLFHRHLRVTNYSVDCEGRNNLLGDRLHAMHSNLQVHRAEEGKRPSSAYIQGERHTHTVIAVAIVNMFQFST